MKTLKDKRIITKCNIGKPDYIYWEKDIKQAIKDLKRYLDNILSFEDNPKIERNIDKIFGVWEEINKTKKPKKLICKNCKKPMQWNIPHICKVTETMAKENKNEKELDKNRYKKGN